MAHYPAFPGPGTAPSSTAPTAAEKAALDGANPPLSGTNVVVGASQLGPQLTANQAAAIQGALNPSASNLFVTVGPGGNVSTDQLGAIAANTALSPTVGGIAQSASQVLAALPMMARGGSSTGGTVTWDTQRTDLTNANWYALLFYYPATGPTEVITGTIVDNTPNVTFVGTFSGGGELIALLFRGTIGALNVSP